jgi:ABC-type sugar transport system ATPase subunit
MDEPLSNLDAALGGRLRREILRLHTELAFTLVYVTHSHDEANAVPTPVMRRQNGDGDR